MIKVEVIEKFTLKDYKKLKNIKKILTRKENEFGIGDTFECDDEMLKYLTGGNSEKKVVVQVLEIIPEIKESKLEIRIEEKSKKKKTNKKKKEE